MSEPADQVGARRQLESLLGADLRQLTSEGDRITRSFAARNKMAANDLRALLFVVMAEETRSCLTPGQLGRRMGLSGAAITYIIERLADAGHLVRQVDPTDRRKAILRRADPGTDVARAFLTALDEHNRRAFTGLSDADLQAAHRAFIALLAGMIAFGDEIPD